MKRQIEILLVSICCIIALLPAAPFFLSEFPLEIPDVVLVAINASAWFLIVFLLHHRFQLFRQLDEIATSFSIPKSAASLEEIFFHIFDELKRKNDSLSLGVLEKRINNKEELAQSLDRIVSNAYRLLKAESAELALFDREAGSYHSSLVVGRPIRTGAQAMLSGAVEGEEKEPSPDVLVEPVAFSGTVLGSLRVALAKGQIPGSADREIMRICAIQASLAIVNTEYTNELMRLKSNSEETVKAKTGFLANLSHEIRGPLGIILNAVEIVLDGLCGPLNDDQIETLAMVRSNGEHLLELINDVLDYAKIESGKITPHRETILVNALLKDITGVVRTQATAKSHRLSCTEPEDALAISCDRRHIRQMLINLLTNAIKYTPDGGMIKLSAERLPAGKIRISVKDSGIGIPASERHRVFSAFERVNNAYAIQQTGSGLGMPLTRRLAAVNGGSIDFESESGKGSHFWLIFDSVEYERSEASDDGVEELQIEGKGELILLMESKNDERSMFQRYLGQIGFTVLGCSSMNEGLSLLKQNQFSLILLDNRLVDEPEQSTVNSFREAAGSSLLPVVLISSRAFAFDIEKYLKAGIDLCLVKPFPLKRLASICRKLIDGDMGRHKPEGPRVIYSEEETDPTLLH